jgi:CTP:molybdopterin cytidylyltransferase MocA
VPAAGSGSRLGLSVPKLLATVNGRPMFSWLLDLYRGYVDRVVVVVRPEVESLVRAYGDTTGAAISYAQQASPTGMLDAILLAREHAAQVDVSHVWITWCDQVAIHPRTVANLERLSSWNPGAPLVMPTVMRDNPYIHLERDGHGCIAHVLHRREGDPMPARGESDMGLFSLSRQAYFTDLPAFATGMATSGLTGERNFLPFVPWIAGRGRVITFAAVDEMEAVGVNTPEEREAVEVYLASRGGG